MTLSLGINIIGGLGLLLLGMKLMTDGLKLAGGPLLRHVLGRWTRTRLRGLLSGFAITALVQSSGAVTVAAIGFVNAGIMALEKAIWVVYGSNVGTTTTAWIVALLGFDVDINALALPCIAFGTALWLAGRVARRTALGEALAGFGLFFLGIELLQTTLHGLGSGVAFHALPSTGLAGALVYLGIGFGLTFAMQSSSAAMALILTATAGGLAPLHAAAAVIGANVGTTSTAVIVSIGATPNAKRLAAAHVFFNLITGAVALALLGPMLQGILWGRGVLGLSADPASVLALYHTFFNILGVVVLWPITSRLVDFVQQRFRSQEEQRSTPKYLDDTVVRTPSLAVGALVLESRRMGESACNMAQSALRCLERPCRDMQREKAVLDALQRACAEFAARVGREGLGEDTAENLPRVVRAGQYYNAAAEAAMDADALRQGLAPFDEADLERRMEELLQGAEAVIEKTRCGFEVFDSLALQQELDVFEKVYQDVKAVLLEAGATGRLPVDQMVLRLDYISRVRRMMEQLGKGALHLDLIAREYAGE